MSAYRSPWFRFWVDFASEAILRGQYRALRVGHRHGLWAHIVALWVALRMMWLYHRCLDLASIGLGPTKGDPLHDDGVEYRDCPHGHLRADWHRCEYLGESWPTEPSVGEAIPSTRLTSSAAADADISPSPSPSSDSRGTTPE